MHTFTAVLLPALLLSNSAHACWTCEGSSEEECRVRIEESRNSTAEQIAKNGGDACSSIWT